MSTESSAVVRFISRAQRELQSIEDSSSALPDFTDDLKPLRRSYKVPLLVLGVLLLAGGAAAGGVYVGKHYFGAPSRDAAVSAPVAAPVAAVPVAPVAPVAAAVAPAPAAPPAPVAAVSPEVLAETGFDVRVKPAAIVSLDGRVLGKAPLRVRNLTPGAHVLDIEAPRGFFSRRVEIELDAGEPQNVNLALDPISPADEVGAGQDSKSKKVRRDRRRSRGKSRRARSSRKPVRAEVAKVEAKAGPATRGENGTLMLGSKPPCDIYIDGAATGLKTPQRAIELAAGTHRITLVNTELDIKKSFTVEITPGNSTRTIHDLTGKI